MAVTPNSIVRPQSLNGGTPVTFANADGTTAKTTFTPGANGSRVYAVAATTTDTSANDVALFVRSGGTDYLVGTVRVPLASGTDGVAAAVDLLNAAALPWLKEDESGNTYLPLAAGETLKAGPLAAVTAAKTLTLVPRGEDF